MPTNSEDLGKGSSLRHILNWFQNHYRWPLLLPLLLVSLGVGILSSMDFMGWERDGYVLKPQLEIAHPGLLSLFIAISAFGWLTKGSKVSGWMAFLGTALLIREIHFIGSDYIMFAMLIGLLVYAWRNPNRFTPLWQAHWSLSFLVTCFMYYACSEALFDRALIEKPFELILGNPDWELPYISNIEESQETLGGLYLVISSTIFVFRPTAGDSAPEVPEVPEV